MADVTPLPRRARDRGQMLLVAAFGIAVMLVALALILNTSIYTENIATRGSDISGGKDAARYLDSTRTFAGESISVVNYRNNSTADTNGNYIPLTEQVTWSVWNYNNMSGRNQAMGGVVTNVTLTRQSDGTRIFRDSEGDLMGDSGERNWTVVENTEYVRNLTVDASNTSLATGDPSDHSPVKADPLFAINVSDSAAPGTEHYRVVIFENMGKDNEVVAQVFDDGTYVGECRRLYGTDDHVDVDVTAGTMSGSECAPLAVVEQATSDEFDLHFNDTHDGGTPTITGTYTVVTNKSYTNVASVTAGGPPPYKTRAIYSTAIHFVYESKRLTVETDVRAAPGEFDD